MDSIKRLSVSRYILILLSIFFLLVISILIGLLTGPTSVSLKDFTEAIFSSHNNSSASQIIFEIRLPRVLFALAIGGGLSIAGAAFQSILMNPLAEPYILGISSGGTFGAVLSFLL